MIYLKQKQCPLQDLKGEQVNNLIVDFKASQLEKDLITTDRKDLQELKERLQKYGQQAYGKQTT